MILRNLNIAETINITLGILLIPRYDESGWGGGVGVGGRRGEKKKKGTMSGNRMICFCASNIRKLQDIFLSNSFWTS